MALEMREHVAALEKERDALKASAGEMKAEAESPEAMPEWLRAAEDLLQASMAGGTAHVAGIGKAASQTVWQEMRGRHLLWRRRATMAAVEGRACTRAAVLLQRRGGGV